MSRKGFTLLELIIVISIIAVLSTIGLNAYTSVQRSARDTRRKSDLKEMQTALETFRAENGRYPDTCNDSALTICPIANTQWWGEAPNPYGPDLGRTGSTGFIVDLAPVFIPVLLRDPRHNTSSRIASCNNPNTSLYLYRSNGTDYKLLAHCTPEEVIDPNDTFFDPCRPTWAIQVSSGNVSRGIAPCNGSTNGW